MQSHIAYFGIRLVNRCQVGYLQEGMLATFLQCKFSLEFSEILRHNLIYYHRLGVSGNFKIMHCGILIHTPCRIHFIAVIVPDLFSELSDQSCYCLTFSLGYQHAELDGEDDQ